MDPIFGPGPWTPYFSSLTKNGKKRKKKKKAHHAYHIVAQVFQLCPLFYFARNRPFKAAATQTIFTSTGESKTLIFILLNKTK